jgi:hypothetical protein
LFIPTGEWKLYDFPKSNFGNRFSIFQTMMQQEEFTCDNNTGASVVTGACLLARTKSLVVFNGMQLQIVDVDAAKN